MNKKLITADDLAAVINTQISREQDGIDLHDKLAEVLETFDGKKLTRRLVSKLEAVLPDSAIVYWHEIAKMTYIQIWNYNGFTIHKRFQALVAYSEDKESYNPDLFPERDLCHAKAAHERQGKRLARLNDCKGLARKASVLNAYNAAREALNDEFGCSLADPDMYHIREHFVNGKEGE
jgi:hypothetical protein